MRRTIWSAVWACCLAHVLSGCAGQPLPATNTPQSAAANASPSPSEATAVPASQETGVPLADAGGDEPLVQAQKARTLLGKGQYEAAISEAKVALRQNERYVPAMEVIARAYFHLGKYEFADSICDLAIEIQQENGRCYNLRGFVALKNGDSAMALSHFEASTKEAKDYGPGWLNFGAQLLQAKNYEAAIPALEKATEILADRPQAYVNLGSAYRGAGDLVKAQQAYQQALLLLQDFAPAHFNLGILYLDAQTFPGLSRVEQLERAINALNRYKEVERYRTKEATDEVEDYLKEANKLLQRERKRLERESAAKPAEPGTATEQSVKEEK